MGPVMHSTEFLNASSSLRAAHHTGQETGKGCCDTRVWAHNNTHVRALNEIHVWYKTGLTAIWAHSSLPHALTHKAAEEALGHAVHRAQQDAPLAVNIALILALQRRP